VKIGVMASLLVAPTLAHAEPERRESSDPGVYVVIGALAANTAFTIYNVATIGERKSDLYAFGESVLTVPQTIVFGGLALLDEEDGWGLTALTVWTAALAVHGIYTLATDENESTTGRTVMLSVGDRF
jgi:hypothetical protein